MTDEKKPWTHMDELLFRATEFLAARHRVRGYSREAEDIAIIALDKATGEAQLKEGLVTPEEKVQHTQLLNEVYSRLSPLTFEEMERDFLTKAVARAAGNLTRVSNDIGMPRATLYRKVKQYGIVE